MKLLRMTLLLTLCLGGPLAAQETRFSAAPFADRVPAGEPQPWAILVGADKYTFLAPAGWHATENKENRRVVLRKEQTEITIAFSKPESTAPVKPAAKKGEKKQPTDWRHELIKQLPSAEMAYEPLLRICGEKAETCDVQWTLRSGVQYSGRFARAVLEGEQIDIALVCPAENFDAETSVLQRLLAAFNNGKNVNVAHRLKIGKE